MNQFAVIDIGTNSVLMLIAERQSGKLTPLVERAEITRLGAGYAAEKKLQAGAMRRTLRAVKKFSRLARKKGVEPWIFGTEILRIAENSVEFLRTVKRETGLEIRILSGKEEAEFTYRGAIDTLNHPPAGIAVIDIGGGSTEIALGDPNRPRLARSFPLGAVKLLESFKLSDPPSAAEMNQMEQFIQTFWQKMPRRPLESCLIGVGGTLTTLAAVNQHLPRYCFEKVDGFTLSQIQIEKSLDRFMKCTLQERKTIIGLEPERADIIVPATLILKTFMDWSHQEEIVVSARGVRFGFLKAILQNRGVKPPSAALA